MSDLGNLSHCMVDSDAAANGRAKALRGKALAASLVLEAAAIGVVLLWPLVTLGVLPSQLILTPVPPYHGVQNFRPAPPHQTERPAPSRPNFKLTIFRQPLVVPAHIAEGADLEPPAIDANGDPNARSGLAAWIPAGSEHGHPVEIARPQPQNKPLKRSEGVMDALLVHRVQPDYPTIAKIARRSGVVLLRATIGTDGEVHELEIVSGDRMLAQAAYAAVRQWRYRPTLLNGQAVEVETQINVNFVLE